MNTQNKVLISFISLVFIGVGIYLLFVNNTKTLDVDSMTKSTSSSVIFDPLNTIYVIDNNPVQLVNGQSKTEVDSTMVFGQPVIGDLNNDGLEDAVLMIVQNTEGSGTFYYTVAAINTTSGAYGTNAIFLGDRIAPQNTEIKSDKIIVNYTDRKPNEAMITTPSVGVSVYLSLDGNVLKKDFSPTQNITYLVSSEDSTKYCNGIDMNGDAYKKTITTKITTSTEELSSTILQLIKATLDKATTGMCHDVLSQADISENKGIVSITPINAWAGSSIVMCSCRPQVEVNLLQIPDITKIIWLDSIDNFNDCVASGNPVMELYPRQCRYGDKTYTENIGNELEKTDFINLETPRPNELIGSPLIIKGQARGSWFFEASFPVFLTDWDGKIIAQGIANAKSDWMTTEFVPFETTLTFEADKNTYSNNGTLILKKDNPSGLPEHDDALEIPVIIN